jgi:hypothetical protein
VQSPGHHPPVAKDYRLITAVMRIVIQVLFA